MTRYNHRNVVVRLDGRIDCEIELTPDQWVPHTCASDDNPEFYNELLAGDKAYQTEDPYNELEVWREGAHVSHVDFGIAVMVAGIISEEEAEGWVTGNSLPSVVQSALNTITDPQAKAIAKLRIRGSTTVYRNDPMVLFLQSHLGLTDTQVDSLFGR